MSRQETVVVVIPTRDRPRMLREAIASVRKQTVRTKIVVVDDGSVVPMTQELVGSDVHLHRHQLPLGPASARNAGAALADGEGCWLAFLDDDDLWSPLHLARLVEAARANRSLLAHSGAVWVTGDRTVLERRSSQFRRPTDLLWENAIGPPAGVLLDAGTFSELGGFDPLLHVLADWELWLRFAAKGAICSVDGFTYAYTFHATNMSRDVGQYLHDVVLIEPARQELAKCVGMQGLRPLSATRFAAWSKRQQDRRLVSAGLYLRSAWETRKSKDVGRAVGALLGESGMRRARGLVAGRPSADDVAWLEALRREVKVTPA